MVEMETSCCVYVCVNLCVGMRVCISFHFEEENWNINYMQLSLFYLDKEVISHSDKHLKWI